GANSARRKGSVSRTKSAPSVNGPPPPSNGAPQEGRQPVRRARPGGRLDDGPKKPHAVGATICLADPDPRLGQRLGGKLRVQIGRPPEGAGQVPAVCELVVRDQGQ